MGYKKPIPVEINKIVIGKNIIHVVILELLV